MLYQLQKLSEEERSLVEQAPVWVTLLIACADHDIEESEIDRAKEIIHIKTFTQENDVKELYKDIEQNLDDRIDSALQSLSANGKERIEYLESQLAKLSDVLPKLDPTYAKQLHKSLQSLAVAVAQSDGGFFGIKRISSEEAAYIHLPMIQIS